MSLRVVEYGHATDPGRQRRSNEDSLFVGPPYFAVADGMGGAQAGEVASGIAVEHFERSMPPDGPPEERLATAARAANERIHELSRADRERAGMGTTITAALVADDEEVAIAHVGDSRAYRLRDGAFEPLTRDHSLVQALIDQGRLSVEEAAHHPQRSIITRALGPEPEVEVDTRTFRAQAGDVFLICSDGLTSMIDDEAIHRIIAGAETLQAGAEALIDAANAAGGRDNITVILFRLDTAETGAQPVRAPARTEQETVADGSLTTGAVRAAVAEREAGGPVAQRFPTPAPPPAAPPKRRRGRRALKSLAVVLVVLIPILVGGWVATRAVYFIGTDNQGLVTVFRGIPYELPGGLKLYETFYESGVPASTMAPGRRSRLLNHDLRSQRDATGLVDQLELGTLEGG